MLSTSEKQRYERQLIMPEISETGQARLRDTSVFIAGVGGLGSISAYYMSAVGVGHVRLIDCDRVALSNLNRQILHRTADIGRWKIDSAAEKLAALNPDCRLEPIQVTVTNDNVRDLAQGCDLILDATDNRGTRLALNRAALALGIPFIFGGIEGFTGMVSTFKPGETACFECIFPTGPDRTAEPIGVLGPTAGVVSSLQCIEAVKYILGLEPLLLNRLLRIDGRTMSFKTTRLIRNDDCHVCGS